jgi:ABC-type Fe3+/spermidine/putrescine transport system ATPase subunit
MSAGRILETGSARELFLAPKTEFGARFFGAGSVFPCTVTGDTPEGERPKGLWIASPLGKLLVPRGENYNPENPLIFIPRDAFSPVEDPPGEGENPVLVTALFKQGIFEGERVILEAEAPGGILFQVSGGLRTELPPKNSPVKWRLDQRLIRFVLPS